MTGEVKPSVNGSALKVRQDHAQKQAHEKVKPSRLGVSLLALTREKQRGRRKPPNAKKNPSHRRRTEPPREHLIALLFGVSAEGSKPHRGAVGINSTFFISDNRVGFSQGEVKHDLLNCILLNPTSELANVCRGQLHGYGGERTKGTMRVP